MATEITMPRLSDTMSEGTVAKWRKRVGEPVEKGEIVVEIETDKATMELEAFQSGVLGRIVVPEGQTVPIGETIALLAAPGETLPEAAATPPASAAPAASVNPAGASAAAATKATTVTAPATPADGRIKASPLARRVAGEQGVDLGRVTGTGPGGRIVREDVEGFVAQRSLAAETAPAAAGAVSAATLFPGLEDGEETIALSSMQRTIVQRMLESKGAAPHFYVTSEIDMTEAVALRRQINGALPDGQGISFNDMVVKGVGLALRAVPEVNSAYRDGRFVRFKGVHVGVAVAIPDGLVVPVIRHADRKSLVQIGADTKDLIEKARTRKLAIPDMEGSTFSITNLGMFDVDQFTGIINQPNAGILAVGAITRKPVVKDDQIVIADRMRVTVSADHRVLYGADAARFLRELKRILEHPMLLVL